jgi:hypothetical protein
MTLEERKWVGPILSVIWDCTRLLFGVVVIVIAAVVGFIFFHDVRFVVPVLGFIFSLLVALSAKNPPRVLSAVLLVLLFVLIDMPFQSNSPVGVVLVLSAPLLPLAPVVRSLSASMATRWEIFLVAWTAFLFGAGLLFAYWYAYPPGGIDLAAFFVPLLLGFVTSVIALCVYGAVRPWVVRRRRRPDRGEKQPGEK